MEILNIEFTAQSLRLIFVDARMDSELLTEDALNVCKLLAIDPNDVVQRDKSEF
jgi:hypothetical protein